MYSIPDLVGGDRMPVSLVSQIGFPVWLVAFGSLDVPLRFSLFVFHPRCLMVSDPPGIFSVLSLVSSHHACLAMCFPIYPSPD
jgi:hypothetical protein